MLKSSQWTNDFFQNTSPLSSGCRTCTRRWWSNWRYRHCMLTNVHWWIQISASYMLVKNHSMAPAYEIRIQRSKCFPTCSTIIESVFFKNSVKLPIRFSLPHVSHLYEFVPGPRLKIIPWLLHMKSEFRSKCFATCSTIIQCFLQKFREIANPFFFKIQKFWRMIWMFATCLTFVWVCSRPQ